MWENEKTKIEWESYEGFTIIVIEGVKRGIFFRWPIQCIDFSDRSCLAPGQEKQDVYRYYESIKRSPVRRFFERIIGNGNIVKNLHTWITDLNFAGFSANILCSPIYFRRKTYTLDAFYTGKRSEMQTAIERIHSYGFADEFNIVAGGCKIEKTKISFVKGAKTRNIKIVCRDYLHYTYTHVIQGVIHNEET